MCCASHCAAVLGFVGNNMGGFFDEKRERWEDIVDIFTLGGKVGMGGRMA